MGTLPGRGGVSKACWGEGRGGGNGRKEGACGPPPHHNGSRQRASRRDGAGGARQAWWKRRPRGRQGIHARWVRRGTAVRLLAKACDVRTRVNHHTAPGLAVLSSRQARALATWAGSGPQPEPQPSQRLAVRQEDRRAPSCQPPVQDPHLGPGTHKKIHKLVRTGWSRSSCPRWRLSTARCAHPLAQEHPDASGRGGGAGATVLVGDRVKEGKKVSPPKNRLSKGSVYIGKNTLQAS